VIREATLDDMGTILPMAIQFNDEYFPVPLNIEKSVRMITLLIEEHEAFISDGGFIGGAYVEDPMRDCSILQEVAWYATDNSGMRLLDRLIDQAVKFGVELRVSTLASSSPIVGKLLQRMGFAPLETSYRLETGAETWQHLQPSSP
jgi:hypothetical protein